MASRFAHHLLATLGSIAALGFVPGTCLSQSPAEPLRADDDRGRIAEEIDAAQSTGGPRSADLIEPLTELGELYRAEGQHALATAALEQARQVVRANYGLHTLEQLPLMQQALENQQALGNLAMVEALEEELFDLAARHPDDLRTVAVHRNFGERRMDILRRFLAGEAPPEVYPESGLYSFTKDAVIMDLLSEAQIHYAGAAVVLLRNGQHASAELRGLEMDIVRAADVVRQRDGPTRATARSMFVGASRMDHAGLGGGRGYGVGRRVRGGDYVGAGEELRTLTNTLWDLADAESPEEEEQRRFRADHIASQYLLGRESYRRLIAYEEAVSTSAPADGPQRHNLQAYLQLADWDLLHSMNGVALDEYAQVHAMLAAADNVEPLLADFFAPPIPIVLPTFLANPLETPTSARYIDVAFEITRYGESRRVEIRDVTPDVSAAARTGLVQLVKSSRFRPRVTDEELGPASPVVVRYYLNDSAND